MRCLVMDCRTTWATFKSKLKKLKKIHSKKFLVFQEMEFASSKIKIILYFRKQNFLALYVRREISELKKKKKQKTTTTTTTTTKNKNKNKKTLGRSLLYFGKWNFLAPPQKTYKTLLCSKHFYVYDKTLLGESECLCQATLGSLPLTVQPLCDLWNSMPLHWLPSASHTILAQGSK